MKWRLNRCIDLRSLSLWDNSHWALLWLTAPGKSQLFSFAPLHLPLATSELPYRVIHFPTVSSTVRCFYNSKYLVNRKSSFQIPWLLIEEKFPQLRLKRLLLYQSEVFIKRRQSFNGIPKALQSYGWLQSPLPPQRYKDVQKAYPGRKKHDDRLKGCQG